MKTTFWKLIEKYKIVIPIIQRDYAQGRDNQKTNVIRKELLNTIKNALDKQSTVDFDFVYGNITDSTLYPLDGQQRLTTLFLIHWYLAAKGQQLDDNNKKRLSKFSYQTRVSSERFCKKMVYFNPQTNGDISAEIRNQSWFAASWNNDPTITAMLNMLKDIQSFFSANDNEQYKLWFDNLITKELIHFQFLDMEAFNLSDDLYIKMNARGKPLTDFENFKARFEKYLDETNRPNYKTRFVDNIDSKWTEMLWEEMSDEIDLGFMRYFDFIAEVGFHLFNSDNERLKDNDNDLKYKVFKNNEILNLLFDSLDAWSEVKSKTDYFCNYFTSDQYEIGKVKLYENNINLFERCLNGVNFVAKDKLMLYAVILQLISKQDKPTELRVVRNLLINSPYEIRAENMHNLFCSINSIMTGTIDYNKLKGTFSGPQVDDEELKAKFIQEHPECIEELYQFEDHYILKGRMSAIELDSETIKQYREAFAELFSKNIDRNTISRAVLCFGDYSQGNGDRWRFANSDDSWHSIFTSADVSKVKSNLKLLLDSMKNYSIDEIIENKISEYNAANNLPWEYYFIKYPKMNDGSGKYVWYSDYDICMLNTTRLSGYWVDPYLWSIYSALTDDEKKQIQDVKNIGYDKKPMNVLGIGMKMCEDGWEVQLIDDNAQSQYDNICMKYKISNNILKVAEGDDRIEIGLNLAKDIIAKG